MSFIIKFVLFSVLISYSFGQKCSSAETMKNDQTYAKLLVLGGSGRKWPEDKKAQLKKFCDQSTEYLSEVEKYKDKCLNQMPKQATGIVIYSIRSVINSYCKKDSKRLDMLISSTKCGNLAKNPIDKCYETIIDKFQGSIQADEKLRIPHTCCNYFKFLECAKQKSLSITGCDETKLDILTNFVREVFDNLVTFLCGEYIEGSDKCEKLGPTPAKAKGVRRTMSFMLPLIDTLASLPPA